MNDISPNVAWHSSRERRDVQHRSAMLWFTGLSGAGKSTLAHAVEENLRLMGCRTFLLDGDNVHHGLSFSENDRRESIRRVGEAVKLFVEADVIVLTAFVSPFREDRERLRRLVGEQDFMEIYCRCPLEVCEQRDVKGLYKKARQGLINNFSGISSPYEPPERPDLTLDTAALTPGECVTEVVRHLYASGKLSAVQE